MNGTGVGSLDVESSTDNGASWVNLWTLSGSQGDAWTEVDLKLPTASGVKVRFSGTTDSWSSDIAIDNITVANVGSTPCPPVSFGSVTAYGGQDVAGDYSIVDNNATLLLQNNTWKYIPFNYTLTSNTVIEFDFRSTAQGEIHGIGFDSDNSIGQNETFQLYGSQNYGVSNYKNYSGSDWVHYSIPVGSFYTGTFDKIFFANDNDGSSGNNSYFRNLIIHEGNCGPIASVNISTNTSEQIIPVIGDEDEINISIYPNPAKQYINLNGGFENATYAIFSISGQLISKGTIAKGEPINVDGLVKGMYILKVVHANGSLSTEFIKE